jgi:hypothetical protein
MVTFQKMSPKLDVGRRMNLFWRKIVKHYRVLTSYMIAIEKIVNKMLINILLLLLCEKRV